MRSADLSINTSPATTSNVTPTASSTVASQSQASTPASNSSAASNGNGKRREIATSDQMATHETAADRNVKTPTDMSQDFLTTLATLLDEGATIETPVAAKPVNVGTLVNEQIKTEEGLDDTDEGVVEAMLLGVQLATTPASVPATSSGSVQVISSDSASLNGSRLISSTALSSPIADVKEVETVTSTALGNSGTTELSIDTRKDSIESTMNNGSTGSALSLSADVRASNHREVREQGSLDARVGTAKWTDELAARVSLFSQRDIHTASLRLSPEHLGPLEIQITVQNDKASVWFGAAHAETRAALEHALPRLRELLSSQGMVLTDSGVFREPPRDQARSYQGQNTLTAGADAMEVDARIKVNRSLLDAYA